MDKWRFFVFNKKSLDYLSENLNESLEEGMLTRLTKDGQLNVFRHFGFGNAWTHKEKLSC